MNRKRAALQAYFAGILDGEGHVGIARRAKGLDRPLYQVKVMVRMTDPAPVFMLWREYPEGKLYFEDRTQKGWKPTYVWFLFDFDALRFLKEIQPFVVGKSDQVKLALSFLAHKRRSTLRRKLQNRGKGCPYSQADIDRMHVLWEKIRDAKTNVPNAVNSVNALLDHGMREYRSKQEDVADDVRVLLEGVQTRLSPTDNKTMSAAEKDIVETYR